MSSMSVRLGEMVVATWDFPARERTVLSELRWSHGGWVRAESGLVRSSWPRVVLLELRGSPVLVACAAFGEELTGDTSGR